LAATLDFTSFFTMAFLGAAHFFYSWAVFGLDFKLHICKYTGMEKEIGGKAVYFPPRSDHILHLSFQITHAPILLQSKLHKICLIV